MWSRPLQPLVVGFGHIAPPNDIIPMAKYAHALAYEPSASDQRGPCLIMRHCAALKRMQEYAPWACIPTSDGGLLHNDGPYRRYCTIASLNWEDWGRSQKIFIISLYLSHSSHGFGHRIIITYRLGRLRHWIQITFLLSLSARLSAALLFISQVLHHCKRLGIILASQYA